MKQLFLLLCGLGASVRRCRYAEVYEVYFVVHPNIRFAGGIFVTVCGVERY